MRELVCPVPNNEVPVMDQAEPGTEDLRGDEKF